MSIYEFIVSFIGEIPEQFEFVYTILTIIVSLMILGAFSSIWYFILRLFKGGR